MDHYSGHGSYTPLDELPWKLREKLCLINLLIDLTRIPRESPTGSSCVDAWKRKINEIDTSGQHLKLFVQSDNETTWQSVEPNGKKYLLLYGCKVYEKNFNIASPSNHEYYIDAEHLSLVLPVFDGIDGKPSNLGHIRLCYMEAR